jgi:hypothetical protein
MQVGRLGVAGTVLAVLVSGVRPVEAACNAPGDPDCVDRFVSFTGTVDFFASGASFATNDDPSDDRPNGLVAVAEVAIPERRIPPRATLRAAYLYFGGSLFVDGDGVEVPDTTVELQVPGAADYTTITGDQTYRSGPIPGFPEVTLYSVRADITDHMRGLGGPIHGVYRVRGFDADIFNGPNKHTVANASFSIVLVFEEPRLSPRAIVLFDGMQEVLGSTITLDLSGFIVSQVPSGSLTFYAQEGDCNPGPMSCASGDNLSGAERIRVSGHKGTVDPQSGVVTCPQGLDPAQTITLSGPLNPPNDIFNRTINTVEPPLRNVPGTDIDTFDITQAVRPADRCVTVEITAPFATGGQSGELIGLGYVVVGIDVFAPELEVDSRIEVASARGDRAQAYFPGDPLRVSYVVSNTGNLPATGVSLEADMPPNVVAFQVVNEPTGALVTVEPTGGAHGRGRVTATGIGVRHGDGDELVLLVETDCPLPNGGTLSMTATIGPASEGGRRFGRFTQVPLASASRCGPRFFLFGGGGCAAVEPLRPAEGRAPWAAALGLLGLVALGRRRRRLALGVLAAAAALALTACESEVPPNADLPPPPVIGVGCPDHDDMVVIPPIQQRTPYCIDRFEASLVDGAPGNPDQAAFGTGGDGSTTARAVARRFAVPSRGVSYWQAQAACKNAGKRLCTADEWRVACRGDDDKTYPYGDLFDAERCNGLEAGREDVVEAGAMFVNVDLDSATVAGGCVTQHGAYDMSGNLWEWNATAYLEDARRGLAGGSFRSNATGLRCVTDDNHADPLELDDAYGFRCCADLTF